MTAASHTPLRSSARIDRRRLMVACGLAGLLPGPAVWAARGGGGGTTVTRNKLYLPPTIGLSSTPTVLTARQTSVNFGGGSGRALTFNSSLPGPTLVTSKGDSVSAKLVNGLAQESSVHWHGLIVPTAQDGQPQDAVPAGGDRTYDFLVDQRAALNFYHPHPHMLTGEQVCLGLAGAFIVRDREEDALSLPAGVNELPLVIRDANFDKTGNLIYNPSSTGFSGKTALVNGTRNPSHTVGVGLYRLRVLNGANARLFKLALRWGTDPRKFYVIGNDGGLLPSMVEEFEIEFGPGERLDLLVDFRGIPNNSRLMLRDLNAGWDLLEFVVSSATPGGNYNLPTAPFPTIGALFPPDLPTRTFSFDGMSKINGREYDMDRRDFTVPPYATERWRFTTSGNAPHPIHVHGASFQVLSRSGGRGRLYSWEEGWKDTVLLKDNETVDIAIQFDSGFTGPELGRYLMHCHKLEHEDMGMMANFVVE